MSARDNRLGLVGWDVRYLGYADTTQAPEEVRSMIERLVERRALDLGVDLPRLLSRRT
jgi:hypothetical protein